MYLLTITAVFLVGQVCSHSAYRDNIPNGHKVPNPKIPGTTWQAVGHDDPDDGKHLNKFGEDFKHEDNRWTTKLCQMDSDGDGKTNGAELGDPSCVWREGATPSGPPTGHPSYADNGAPSGFSGITGEPEEEHKNHKEETEHGHGHHYGHEKHDKED